MEKCESCAARTKERTELEKKRLTNRLNRIEGQIRGLKSMVERDAYCPDILIQSTAANAALNAFCKELLAEHIKSCVVGKIKAEENPDEVIDELIFTLGKLMK